MHYTPPVLTGLLWKGGARTSSCAWVGGVTAGESQSNSRHDSPLRRLEHAGAVFDLEKRIERKNKPCAHDMGRLTDGINRQNSRKITYVL